MPILQADFDQIRKLILERSGIVLDSSKIAMVNKIKKYVKTTSQTEHVWHFEKLEMEKHCKK